MTHTAGFEESLLDLLVDDVAKVKPLGASAQGRHPGAHLSAGHRAGVFQLRRIARRLHRCARLRHAVRAVRRGAHLQAAADGAFDIPTARTRVAARASFEQLCRRIGRGRAVRVRVGCTGRRIVGAAPDMAQFMLAHFNGGVLPGGDESNRILKPETTELMHSVANRPGPGVDAMAHGFYEQQRNGVRVIAHGGDLTAFHSELVLIPSAKVGLFVSFNSRGKETPSTSCAPRCSKRSWIVISRGRRPRALAAGRSKEHTAAVAGPYEAQPSRGDELVQLLLYVRPVGGDDE